jgi:hypothetical protein
MEALITALAFAIPCFKRAAPTIIALILITAIANAIRQRRVIVPYNALPNLFIAGIFMLLVVGLTCSAQPDEGLNEIGIKLSFLLFPLLGLLLPNVTPSQYARYCRGFIAGCFVFILLTVIRATIRSLESHDLYYMTYESLSWYVHPTYAATYQALSLFLLFQLWLKKEYVLGKQVFHLSAVIVSIIFIAMLSSKAGLIAVLIAIAGAAFVAHRKRIPITYIAVAVTGAFALLIGSTLILPSSAKRISSAMSEVNHSADPLVSHDKEVSYSSTQLRLVTWSASWQLMTENAFGVGTGETEHALTSIYLQEGEIYAAKRKLNAHNQFLQLGAELGWPAVLLICACLFTLLQQGLRQYEPALLMFVALCAMNFLFESFLEVQAGIVFFCFWILIFTKTKSTSSL